MPTPIFDPICLQVNAQPKPEKPIRLKGKDMEHLRRKVYIRDKGICQQCKKFVTWDKCHLAHIKSRGAGGGDTMDNTWIKCRNCHLNLEHNQGIK